ncbi:O-antigen polymerase [Hydrocarboniphaga effusa]|uniref:Oligosaccharide repeat unit polymerase n=1 Tax=Hydrocarboniphaga effusa AP103 TaxID=1172194 RepID=I8HZM7_9GAMM|nr:O-antigen polymerase [Hydrocarboniphaga effusa]EIT69061.1 hypothetical protein WQQ_26430 [Hydrocarboniphaga effusa AP103]
MATFLYCLCLIAPLLLFKKRDIFQPEMIVNAYFVVFIGIGPLAMQAFAPSLYLSGNYDFVLQLISLGYISLNAGFLLSKLTFNSSMISGAAQKRAATFKPTGYRSIAKLLIGIGTVFLLLFFLRAGGIPLLATNKEAARTAALENSGAGYILWLATLSMTGILLYAAIEYWNSKKYGTSPSTWIIISGIFVGIALAGTGSRRYTFWTLIYILSSFHYFRKEISFKYFIAFGLLAFLGVNLFEMYRNAGSDTTTSLLTASYYRVIVYFNNLEATFSAFQSAELMYGKTFFMDILTVLPGKQVDFQSWIKEVTGMEFEGFGVPPTIVGDLYINFGIPGVALGCFVFAYLLRSYYLRSTHPTSRSPITIVSYIMILEVAIRTLTSGISAQAMGALWVFIVLASIKISRKIFFSASNQKSGLPSFSAY